MAPLTKSNQTSFKKGYIQSDEMRRKRSETMREQYRLGLRKPPKPHWNKKSIARMVASQRLRHLEINPIGSRKKTKRGPIFYWLIKISDRGRWRYEHRVIMEKKLGRKLDTGEIVHHLNHDGLDNREKNLQLMSALEHQLHHARARILPKDRWSVRYDFCIRCHKNDSRYASHGLCRRCHMKKWYIDHPGYWRTHR